MSNKVVNDAIDKLQKKYGDRAVGFLGEEIDDAIEVISSGSILLDWALGVGGYPRGRLTEISGPESSGKTTMLLTTMAEAQKQGELIAFIDAEHSLDLRWARQCGIRTHEDDDGLGMVLSQPSYGEQALQIAIDLVKTGEFGLIGVDSVAALTPKAELEGEMEDVQIGAQARIMAKGIRKLVDALEISNTVFIFINQLRDVIGASKWAPQSDTPGGRALKFFSAQRVTVASYGKITTPGKKVIATKTRMKVIKSKVSDPFREIETAIYFGWGIDMAGEVLDAALQYGYVEKAGGWFAFVPTSERMGQGREAAREWLMSKPKIFNKLKKKVVTHLEEDMTRKFEHGTEDS